MTKYRQGYANRGRQLETELETTNQYYNSQGIAKIQKFRFRLKFLTLIRRLVRLLKLFISRNQLLIISVLIKDELLYLMLKRLM